MFFRRKLNYRNIILGPATTGEVVGVRKRNGDMKYVAWLGILSREQALSFNQAKAVKLEMNAYRSNDDPGQPWLELPPQNGLQGCLVANGVYAVVTNDAPRIVPFKMWI